LPLGITNASIYEKDVILYYDAESYSGVVLELHLARKWTFVLYTVILPSLLFTTMSYVGFWIDKNGVPGRAYLGSLAIFININAYILPQVSSITWIGNFLLGCLMFGVFTMIEYCILNYCTFTFNAMNIKIEEMITQINSQDVIQEHELQVLAEVRKNKLKTNNSKDLDDRIKSVGHVVLNKLQKEVSFGNLDDENKGKEFEEHKNKTEHIDTEHLQTEMRVNMNKINPTDLLKEIPEEFKDPNNSKIMMKFIDENDESESKNNDENESESKNNDEDDSDSNDQKESRNDSSEQDSSFKDKRNKSSSESNYPDNDLKLENRDSVNTPIKHEFLPVSPLKGFKKSQELEENSKEFEKRISKNKSGNFIRFKLIRRQC
jgi:hypothetical protein